MLKLALGRFKRGTGDGVCTGVTEIGTISFCAALLFGGMGLVAALEYEMALGGTRSLFVPQSVYIMLGIMAAAALTFGPHVRLLAWFVPWGAFASGLLLLGVSFIRPVSCNGQHYWVDLFGVNVNACLWSSLLLLPGIVHWMETRLAYKRLFALGATLIFVNLCIVNMHNLSALCWFNGSMVVLLLASSSCHFLDTVKLSRHEYHFRVGLIIVLLICVAIPVVGCVRDTTRLWQVFGAWLPQSWEKHERCFHAWAVHGNFLDGGLVGSHDPFTAERIVNGKATISDFVLQMVGFRYGTMGVLAVIAMCLWLAWLWIGYALHTPSPRLRLWRLGLTAFLLFHFWASIARTTGLIPVVPSTPFPFLAYGGNITLWSFACLGLLLRNRCAPATFAGE